MAVEVGRFNEHRNAFGFLRLLFASLVIAAHLPELTDGNRQHELLWRIFGTVTLGDLAVDGFFLISGYLIAKSFLQRPVPALFIRNRLVRIFPAFLVASVVSVLIVAPLGGASLEAVRQSAGSSIRRLLTLRPPEIATAFAGAHAPGLNGSLWTIGYEFRCYLLILLLGISGLLRRSRLIAVLAILMLLTFEAVPKTWFAVHTDPLPFSIPLVGDVSNTLRLTGIFLIGTLFYLERSRIRFTRAGVAFAAVGMIICLSQSWLAEPGLAMFGGYLMLGFARWGSSGFISHINNKNDISYGVYLYAWPIQKLVQWHAPATPLWTVGLITLGGAWACGCLSWFALEKPVMARLR